MPSTPFMPFTSPYVVLPIDNIDTDQIIPARFLKTIERSGLGQHAFHDWRYDAAGVPRPDFALNRPGAERAHVLVVGHNFGCGSSREHAVWALLGAGFKAVVSTAFADIFRGNALGNGLLPIEVNGDALRALRDAASDTSSDLACVSVDLEAQTLTLPTGESVVFPVAPFAKYCLLHGVTELDVLLAAEADIARYESAHASSFSTRNAEALA